MFGRPIFIALFWAILQRRVSKLEVSMLLTFWQANEKLFTVEKICFLAIQLRNESTLCWYVFTKHWHKKKIQSFEKALFDAYSCLKIGELYPLRLQVQLFTLLFYLPIETLSLIQHIKKLKNSQELWVTKI